VAIPTKVIYDFVKVHHHFSDPEWDGEPKEPKPTHKANLAKEQDLLLSTGNTIRLDTDPHCR